MCVFCFASPINVIGMQFFDFVLRFSDFAKKYHLHGLAFAAILTLLNIFAAALHQGNPSNWLEFYVFCFFPI